MPSSGAVRWTEMSPTRLSYLKTTAIAALLGALGFGVATFAALDLGGIARVLLQGVGSLVGVGCESVALGGLVVLHRSWGLEHGRPDLFLRMNAKRDLRVVRTGELGWGTHFRRLLRRILGRSYPLVGDLVEVRSLAEIRKTLDDAGCVDGLPYMEEMAAFSGRRFRIFRCVDKIFDYGRSGRLRRIEDVVLLGGLRCNGSAHGGCQASCSLLWKTAWLKPLHDDAQQGDEPRADPPEAKGPGRAAGAGQLHLPVHRADRRVSSTESLGSPPGSAAAPRRQPDRRRLHA